MNIIKLLPVMMVCIVLTFSCSQKQGSESGSDTDTDTTNAQSSQPSSDENTSNDMNLEAAPSSTDVSEEDFSNFLAALLSIQEIQQNAQPQMMQAIQETGLDPQRYQEIGGLMQTGDPGDAVSDDEEAKFIEAQNRIQSIQTGIQGEFEAAIAENNLTVEEYQQIMGVVRQDPQLQQRVQQSMGASGAPQ